MKMRKKTILLIDDEPEILKALKTRLEANHFRCVTADDPVTGLAKAARMNPDLILLDLMLPRMSGLGCLRNLKRDSHMKEIPVVVLTALGDAEIAAEAMDLGAVSYLTKSCESQELLDVVKKYA